MINVDTLPLCFTKQSSFAHTSCLWMLFFLIHCLCLLQFYIRNRKLSFELCGIHQFRTLTPVLCNAIHEWSLSLSVNISGWCVGTWGLCNRNGRGTNLLHLTYCLFFVHEFLCCSFSFIFLFFLSITLLSSVSKSFFFNQSQGLPPRSSVHPMRVLTLNLLLVFSFCYELWYFNYIITCSNHLLIQPLICLPLNIFAIYLVIAFLIKAIGFSIIYNFWLHSFVIM